MFVLGIETSCDDTSVALVDSSGYVKALKSLTKDIDHMPFGGILPERASRNHLEFLSPLVDLLLKDSKTNFKDLAGIAVTSRPGLMGSLMVGVVTAKTLALCWDKPLIGVNHLEGHILSPWLTDDKSLTKKLEFPHISLIVSGGHTHLVLVEALGSYKVIGKTKDDAAGEAIDKFSNMLGMGFPGGPKVDAMSINGDAKAFDFPKPLIKEETYNFSFSGLKASASRKLEKLNIEGDQIKKDLCASYLNSVAEVLAYKTEKALSQYKPKSFSVVGGVSANSMLRKKMENLSKKTGVELFIPPLKYCTDNGAMIALAGAKRLEAGLADQDEIAASPRSLESDFCTDLSLGLSSKSLAGSSVKLKKTSTNKKLGLNK